MRISGAVAIATVLAMSCAKAATPAGEAEVEKAAAAALADAIQELRSFKLVLVAGNPSFWQNITDTNKVAIFLDKDTLAGTTAQFSVYPLDRLRVAMHTDPRAWLIEPVAPIRPGYPSGRAMQTLANAIATSATANLEPSAVYTATYQCDAETVTVSVGDKHETAPLGYWGADVRSIEIAARYFCPNYSVTGVTFYKFDK
jgi:hypothetical protein